MIGGLFCRRAEVFTGGLNFPRLYFGRGLNSVRVCIYSGFEFNLGLNLVGA